MHDAALYTTRPDGRITAAAEAYTALAGYLVFPSGGAAEDFFASGGRIGERTVPVAIGPVAARRLAELGVDGVLTARHIGREGIVEEILAAEAGGMQGR